MKRILVGCNMNGRRNGPFTRDRRCNGMGGQQKPVVRPSSAWGVFRPHVLF